MNLQLRLQQPRRVVVPLVALVVAAHRHRVQCVVVCAGVRAALHRQAVVADDRHVDQVVHHRRDD